MKQLIKQPMKRNTTPTHLTRPHVWAHGLIAASMMLGAQAMSHADSISDLEQFNKTFSSASGTFTQKVRGKTTKSSLGTFAFSRPGKFRWTYTSPYEQVLVSNGATLSIYDKDLKQITQRSIGSAIGSSPAAVLFGSGNLAQHFKLEDGGMVDGRNWVHATPKAASNFSSVNIGMKNGVPDAVVMYDNLGQTAVIFLSNFKRNPKLSAGTFNLKAPAGVQVVRQ